MNEIQGKCKNVVFKITAAVLGKTNTKKRNIWFDGECKKQ